LVAARTQRQANFEKTLLHDRHTIHTAFKEKHPSVHHDRDVPGDESDDDEPLDPIGLVLKHTGHVPFSKLESKDLTVSEGDHVATYFMTGISLMAKDRKVLAGHGVGSRNRQALWALDR
jgi:hypothetical protein